MDKYKLIKNVG